MAHYEPAASATRPPPKASKKSVLLIDAESERQLIRATAMRQRGVIVDAVHTGADALGLWKSGSYELVMIEPAGAADDVDGFYRHVLDLKPDQKFAFYSGAPPYLTALSSTRHVPTHAGGDGPRRKTGSSSGGLREAATRIGGLRSVLRVIQQERPEALPDVRPTPPPQASAISFSEAVKNAERDASR